MMMKLPLKTLPRLNWLLRGCQGRHSGFILNYNDTFHTNPNGVLGFKMCPRFLFTHNTESYVKLKEKELHVNPGFGVLHVTGTVDLHIRSTNVQEYPDADRAFVAVHGLPSESCEGITIDLTGEQRDILTVCAAPQSPNVFCEVMVPIKYDLDVKLMDEARVKISKMESDEVQVTTDKGEVNSHGLKSHNIHITTQEGHIISDGSMQGNIFINAKKTHMRAKRLQGLALDMQAEELTTDIESSYMNQSQIKADRGSIRMSNLHGCTDLLIKQGNIVINGFHGQISGFMGSGRMEVQVTDVTGNSTLHLKEGNMKLSVLDTPRHDLEVTAPVLGLSEEVRASGILSPDSHTFTSSTGNPEASTLQATVVSGEVQVLCQNWFSTLGIKLPEK